MTEYVAGTALIYSAKSNRFVSIAETAVHESEWRSFSFDEVDYAAEELAYGVDAFIMASTVNLDRSKFMGRELMDISTELNIPRAIIGVKNYRMAQGWVRSDESDLVIPATRRVDNFVSELRDWLKRIAVAKQVETSATTDQAG